MLEQYWLALMLPDSPSDCMGLECQSCRYYGMTAIQHSCGDHPAQIAHICINKHTLENGTSMHSLFLQRFSRYHLGRITVMIGWYLEQNQRCDMQVLGHTNVVSGHHSMQSEPWSKAIKQNACIVLC